MKTNKIFALAILTLAIFSQIAMISAQKEITYPNANPGTSLTSSLVVQVLKYEPYPVSAGEWFTVYLKVENIGQEDAKNAKFTLVPEYPFSSTDTLVKEYGTIFGTKHGYYSGYPEDSSQVILKYRVKVADNAPEGTSDLKLMIQSNKNDPSGVSVTTLLPIEVGKTKTDFDVVMQDSTTQGTAFAISNIGNNDATAATVSIEPQDNVNITGARSSIIGNLAKGDFTTVSFQILPNTNLNEVSVKIDYTDTAGVRNTLIKKVPVTIDSSFGNLTNVKSASSSTKYYFLIFGIILGMLILFVYRKIKKKK